MVIHDWDDDRAAVILGNCREAMKGDGRLLLVETVLPDGDEPHVGQLLDLAMLVYSGGQERNVSSYRSLLSRAGFKLARVIGSATPMSVVEAVPD